MNENDMIESIMKQHDIFVVDDNGLRELASDVIDIPGCNFSCYATAEDCLEQLPKRNCDLLITVVKTPDDDGQEFLREVKKVAPWVPAIVVCDCDDVSMAVKALKLGAIGFIDKPSDKGCYLCKIKSLIEKIDFDCSCEPQELTRIERKILRLILDGKSNKEIADGFQRTVRTIERHRLAIFQKFGVRNVVELVKKAAFIDLDDVE